MLMVLKTLIRSSDNLAMPWAVALKQREKQNKNLGPKFTASETFKTRAILLPIKPAKLFWLKDQISWLKICNQIRLWKMQRYVEQALLNISKL